MTVLDTNVVSELMRPEPDRGVMAWVDRMPPEDVFVTAVTAAELRYGAARLSDGRRKRELVVKVEELFAEDFRGRVLPFDDAAAGCYAEITVAREREGLAVSMADAQIAAICRSHGVPLATRNTKDFSGTGVELLDPWNHTTE
ncbi:type II toxin-antitoxin system VapC family toxin [Saccharomonospora iraqiensis]|uniref:type II toxin-antitoxin system VapC family toxin n=1 Tax=Saccharomonospora iraqiensis TaxID=52698 RepID=UPI000403A871|nr:type II toxin-antitoxin system VapC family toxin [Saccharomonospora iraqiensis]